jgi:hypothetical protein
MFSEDAIDYFFPRVASTSGLSCSTLSMFLASEKDSTAVKVVCKLNLHVLVISKLKTTDPVPLSAFLDPATMPSPHHYKTYAGISRSGVTSRLSGNKSACRFRASHCSPCNVFSGFQYIGAIGFLSLSPETSGPRRFATENLYLYTPYQSPP